MTDFAPTPENAQKVEVLLELQRKFDSTVQDDFRFKKLGKRHRLNALMNFMISECNETKEALGFLHNDQDKWWKNHVRLKTKPIEAKDGLSNEPLTVILDQGWVRQDNTDYDHVLEETIDILHVLLSFWCCLGVTAEEIAEAYIKKNKVNFERQNNNY